MFVAASGNIPLSAGKRRGCSDMGKAILSLKKLLFIVILQESI